MSPAATQPPVARRYAPLLALLLLVGPAGAEGFDPGRSGFVVELGSELWPYRVASASVMPGARLRVVPRGAPADLELASAAGRIEDGPDGGWTWRAPREPGLARLSLRDPDGDERMRIHVFVMRPAQELRDGVLGGYRIGSYPRRALGDLAIYQPPSGFIEVAPGMESLEISPHFRLGEFVCKQGGSHPRYLVLRSRLLLKLEAILEALNREGLPVGRLAVLSGYRTPFYNRELGNSAYSRHLWGGAADIFVDVAPEDGHMDDLDGDGRLGVGDALWLARRIEALDATPRYRPLVGGLASYAGNAFRGAFVHVDVRGRPARWGEGAPAAAAPASAE